MRNALRSGAAAGLAGQHFPLGIREPRLDALAGLGGFRVPAGLRFSTRLRFSILLRFSIPGVVLLGHGNTPWCGILWWEIFGAESVIRCGNSAESAYPRISVPMGQP